MRYIFALILTILILTISGCSTQQIIQQTGQQSNFLLTKDEMNSLGLDLKIDPRYDHRPPSSSGILLYSDFHSAIYSVITDPDMIGDFELLTINVYTFDSNDNLNTLYRRWYEVDYKTADGEIRCDELIEENTFGDKSYFVKKYENIKLVFMKGNYIVRIEGHEDIGVDKVRSAGEMVENKMS